MPISNPEVEAGDKIKPQISWMCCELVSSLPVVLVVHRNIIKMCLCKPSVGANHASPFGERGGVIVDGNFKNNSTIGFANVS